MPAVSALGLHERVAFQFSGGKDSTAALLLMRDAWPRMTVYWLNSGDAFPETAAFVRRVAAHLPRFVEVQGRVNEVIGEFGPPADVIGADASETAWAMGVGRGHRLQDRALCCLRSKMAPMHQRMLDDGITMIVRGQKKADHYKGPFSSGDVVGGFEFLYPIETWTDSDVFDYLDAQELMPPLYDKGMKRSGDCMSCSAWLGDGRDRYLADNHPEAHRVFVQRVRASCAANESAVGNLFSAAARN